MLTSATRLILRSRLANRVQLTTDGHRAYLADNARLELKRDNPLIKKSFLGSAEALDVFRVQFELIHNLRSALYAMLDEHIECRHEDGWPLRFKRVVKRLPFSHSPRVQLTP
jgi:hypothetical protein